MAGYCITLWKNYPFISNQQTFEGGIPCSKLNLYQYVFLGLPKDRLSVGCGDSYLLPPFLYEGGGG